jgi:hypothetical protein
MTAKTVDTLAQAPTPLFRGFPLATHRRSIHRVTGGPPQSKIVRSAPVNEHAAREFAAARLAPMTGRSNHL